MESTGEKGLAFLYSEGLRAFPNEMFLKPQLR